jgi:prokaryotic ubiquitin-like protein Pup
MAEQDRARPRQNPETTEEEGEATKSEIDTEAIDDLLDEIDSVLEENSEEFVKNYVQKGGE